MSQLDSMASSPNRGNGYGSVPTVYPGEPFPDSNNNNNSEQTPLQPNGQNNEANRADKKTLCMSMFMLVMSVPALIGA